MSAELTPNAASSASPVRIRSSFISVLVAFSYMFLSHYVKPASDLSVHFPSLTHGCELLEVRSRVIITSVSPGPSTGPGAQRSFVIVCSAELDARQPGWSSLGSSISRGVQSQTDRASVREKLKMIRCLLSFWSSLQASPPHHLGTSPAFIKLTFSFPKFARDHLDPS